MTSTKKNTQLKVNCLGTCNIDFLSLVSRFAQADDEISVENLCTSVGGSGANFSLVISSLGISTGILARVGNDSYGDLIRHQLSLGRVNTERLLSIEERTGMAFIAVNDLAERSIYSYMGANAKFKLEKEDIKHIKSSDLLHITGMYCEVAQEASKYADLISFNPGTALILYGMNKLRRILEKTSILFLNQKEVTLLTGKEWEEGGKLLVKKGVPLVVVTKGVQGAVLFNEEGVTRAPAKPVKALDTTGAGDNFAAGFIAYYLQERKMEDCLNFANGMASICVQKLGGSVLIDLNSQD